MKKISTILVLMLIALMLFVSCNNSTPTKDNSTENGSNNTQTEETPDETPKERDAVAADYDLVLNIFNAIQIFGSKVGDLPADSYEIVGENNFEFKNCQFSSYSTNGSNLSVILNGSVNMEKVSETEFHYTCNLTKGTKIGDTDYTVEADLTFGSTGYNFTTAIINGIKVNGLSELVNKLGLRTATSDEVVLIKKLLKSFDYLVSNIETLKNDGIKVSSTHYEFTNFSFNAYETSFILYGTLDLSSSETPKTYNFYLDPGTKIDEKNHFIKVNLTVSKNESDQTVYTVNRAEIDSSTITNLAEALTSAE